MFWPVMDQVDLIIVVVGSTALWLQMFLISPYTLQPNVILTVDLIAYFRTYPMFPLRQVQIRQETKEEEDELLPRKVRVYSSTQPC